ncbi:MAG: DUF4214 domain-containing protein, partial [Acidobacteriota bacterium]|nr:DUF4214 domain-containing protein [Acidobacteriota bacterium]
MSEVREREVDVEKLMAEIREAAQRREVQLGAAPKPLSDVKRATPRRSSTLPTSGAPAPHTPAVVRNAASPKSANSNGGGSPQLILQSDFLRHDNDHYHINDLLPYHDTAFVRNAYRAILKREPDDAGCAQQLGFLRSGRFDKIDILSSLRRSPEGRKRNVRIDGLSRPATVRRLGRLPIAGYAIRLGLALIRLPVFMIERNQFEAHALAQQQQTADFINLVLADLSQWPRHLMQHRQQLETLIESVRQEAVNNYEQLIAAQEQLKAIDEQLSASAERLSANDEQLRAVDEQLRSEQQRGRNEIHAQMVAGAERAKRQSEVLLQRVEERLREFTHRLQQTRTEIVLQERRVSPLLQEARQRHPTAPSDGLPLPPAVVNEAHHELDALYASIEDQFRGNRADIKEAMRFYVPYIHRATGGGAVVDLGCGRGEWLEVLKEERLPARGVDQNQVFIEQCRGLDLEVVPSHVIDYLRSLPDGSLRAVTAFHLVEHLPFPALMT